MLHRVTGLQTCLQPFKDIFRNLKTYLESSLKFGPLFKRYFLMKQETNNKYKFVQMVQI